MTRSFDPAPTRRTLLITGTAATLSTGMWPWSGPARAAAELRLSADDAGAVRLVPEPHPETAVWAYNSAVPGPEIRVRQGKRLKVAVENRLQEETTIHWHGVRVPNAMDGVPHLTQKPIAPGETFVYEFDCPDAGTFWYHPHQRSLEQVDRGLAGALIVEEPQPIRVDRDVTWVLDDWRLLRDASISGDFGNMMDTGMSGRVGNTVTINGRVPELFAVRAGERIRLRLINAANARIFGLEFEGHRPQVIALDGQPVEPHAPDGDRVVLGPAMRADLVVDMTGAPGARFQVIDTFYRDLEYRLVDFVYADVPLREQPLDAPIRLPDNPLAEPDLNASERHEVNFGGGMMGGMMGGGGMDGGMMGGGMMGDMMQGMRHDGVWTVNGVSATGHVMEPMLTLEQGWPCVLAMHKPHRMAPSDSSPRPRVPGGEPQRPADPLSRVAGHRPNGSARARRDRLRGRQSGRLDDPLPHPGAPGGRDDGRDPRVAARNPNMRCTMIPLSVLLALAAPAGAAQAAGDARRGAEQYRHCTSCHSLEPKSHLTGPSLAGLWGRQAGQAEGYVRYSHGLRSANFTWDAETLTAWLADPQGMIPGTYMVFRGIADDQARADLVAFLAVATAPGGATAVVEQGLAPAEYIRGQKPDPLRSLPPDAQVTEIRHCRDSYFVTTADGVETPYWEMNVRLKLDTRETGPEPGKPAILGAGMAGDRVSVVFSNLQELTELVRENCP